MLLAGGTAIAQQQVEPQAFLVKPYVQLGNEPNLQKSESMEIIWFSIGDDEEAKTWKFEFDADNNSKWKEGKLVEAKAIGSIVGQQYYRFIGKVTDLKPGQPFSYRVSKDGKQVFLAGAVARKAANQSYRFAVVGDVGAGSSGQKNVVYQLAKKKPDFLVIPGDIVYDRGLVSEYLRRFFPILNSDVSSPETGAPLLRSTLTLPVLGNHDIALTNAWEGVDFSKFPDALGYYLLWSAPLDGPSTLVNGKNTTRIVGNPAAQVGFAKAAGKRFPVMANYSFDYGNSHWVVLDGNPYMDWTDKKTRKWLEDDLEKNKKTTWKFATFHQPGFSVDEAHQDEQRMRLLSDIFEKYKVDIVFSGHAHCYQRTIPLKFKPDMTKVQGTVHNAIAGAFTLDKAFDGKKQTTPTGVIYIVTGGGGARLYNKSLLANSSPFLQKYVYSHSFTLCDINDKTLKLTQVAADGKVIDEIVVSKAGAAPIKIGDERHADSDG